MLSFGLQERKPYLFSSFQTTEYVKRTLVHAFLPLNTSCVDGLLHFNFEKHHSYVDVRFLTPVDFIYCLF